MEYEKSETLLHSRVIHRTPQISSVGLWCNKKQENSEEPVRPTCHPHGDLKHP